MYFGRLNIRDTELFVPIIEDDVLLNLQQTFLTPISGRHHRPHWGHGGGGFSGSAANAQAQSFNGNNSYNN